MTVALTRFESFVKRRFLTSSKRVCRPGTPIHMRALSVPPAICDITNTGPFCSQNQPCSSTTYSQPSHTSPSCQVLPRPPSYHRLRQNRRHHLRSQPRHTMRPLHHLRPQQPSPSLAATRRANDNIVISTIQNRRRMAIACTVEGGASKRDARMATRGQTLTCRLPERMGVLLSTTR